MRGALLGMVMDSLVELKLVGVALTELHRSSEMDLRMFLKPFLFVLFPPKFIF
jgi:hypothetical protein